MKRSMNYNPGAVTLMLRALMDTDPDQRLDTLTVVMTAYIEGRIEEKCRMLQEGRGLPALSTASGPGSRSSGTVA